MGTPIVVSETYQVAAGYETDFYSWGTALLGAAEQAYGHLGGHVRDPEVVAGQWQIVHRWADRGSAVAWEESDVRAHWLAAADAFARPLSTRARVAGAAAARYRPGEHQGVPPSRRGAPDRPADAGREPDRTPPTPPPRWKSAVVTLTAVFPPVLIFNMTVIPHLTRLPVVLRTSCSASVSRSS